MKQKYVILFCFLLPVLLVSCLDRGQHVHEDEAQYTCPMHPEIVQSGPGSCPVCHMDLVKVEKEEKSEAQVELNDLLQPVNELILTTVPVVALQQRTEAMELDVPGRVAYDTRQVGTISSRFSGRIEKLYLRYTYQPVTRGQKIMEIYSPEVATAQQQLLFLLKNDPANTSLKEAAESRLRLLGVPEAEIRKLQQNGKIQPTIGVYSNYAGFATDIAGSIAAGMPADNMTGGGTTPLQLREGMYLQKGQPAFTVYNAQKVWILLDILPEQQTMIRTGDAVVIAAETNKGATFRGRISYIEPIFRPGNKTLIARVELDNRSLRLPINSRVHGKIFTSTAPMQWLPKSAVLSMGTSYIVFKKEGSGFRAQAVTTGVQASEAIQITGGLTASDSVVLHAGYLVDHASFIKIKKP